MKRAGVQLRWRRYLAAFHCTVMALLLAGVLLFLVAAVVETGPALAVLAGGVLGFWLGVRIWRAGVFVIGKNLLVRGLLFNRTVPLDRILDLIDVPVKNLVGRTMCYIVVIRYFRYVPRYVSTALPPVDEVRTIEAIGLWALAAMTESGAIRLTERIRKLIADHHPEPEVQGKDQGLGRVGP